MPHALLGRIRSEYVEMPGLRLTVPQVQRLCGGERAACEEVLGRLVNERFLYRKEDGTYARLTGGPRIRVSRAASGQHAVSQPVTPVAVTVTRFDAPP
jgi:hypothetical protein